MNNKFKLKKGDEVIVLVGKDKGKTGKIVKMLPKVMKAVVSEINKVKKNQKPDNNQPGGIVDKEMPIHISNLSFYDPLSKKGVRIGYKLDKNKASSTAVFPPPTTATSLSLKKNPSHVAHAETPNPINSCSPFMFNQFAFAPVAITMELDFITSFSVLISKGKEFKSTSFTKSTKILVPKDLAWFFICSISHGPWTGFSKPG